MTTTLLARTDGRTAGVRDLRSFPELFRTLLRYAPVILAITALAGVGTAVLAKTTETSGTAKTRVALTSRVVWPFYDAARDKQVEIVALPSTFDEVASRIADVGTLEKLSTTVPTGQAFVDVEATASSTSAAVAAANALADYLVELSGAEVRGRFEAERDEATKTLASIDTEIANLTAEVAQIDTQIAALQIAIAVQNPSQANLTEIRRLESQRSLLLERRSAQSSRRGQALYNLDAANLELSTTEGQVVVLRRAFQGDTDPSRTRGLVLLAAGAAAILGAFACLAYDATYQRIRSRRHAGIGAARGHVVLDPTELGSDVAYVNRLLEAREGDEILGVSAAYTSTTASARAVSAIAGVLTRGGAGVVTFGEVNAASSSADHLQLRAMLEGGRPGVDAAIADLRQRLAARGHVHIEVEDYLKRGGIVSHTDSLQRVLRAAQDAADVVIVDCGIASDASTRWRSLGGLCGLLVVVIDPKRTRQSALRRAIRTAAERPIRDVVVSVGIPHVVVTQQRTIATVEP